MQVTDKDIASFFGVTPKTISTHKNSGDLKLNNRYKALKEFYINNKDETAAATVARKLGECLELISGLDVNQGNDLKKTI
ncbi:MAG: hypothetical protein QG567_2487 [Campylobacterota bacterium]|nr:hypothetical protein [Campylobacterota bacterium]